MSMCVLLGFTYTCPGFSILKSITRKQEQDIHGIDRSEEQGTRVTPRDLRNTCRISHRHIHTIMVVNAKAL